MHLKIALASFLVLSSTIAGCQTQGSTPKTEVNTPAPDKVVNNEQKEFVQPYVSPDLRAPGGRGETASPPCEEGGNLFLLRAPQKAFKISQTGETISETGEKISEITDQTISAYPTFFFHLDTPTSNPIFFALGVAGSGIKKNIFEKKIAGTHSGLFAVDLPPDQPPLEFGKKYRWSVQIVCTEKQFLTDNNYQLSIVERVPVAPKLQQKLASATSDYERARLYKQSGIWIDAVSSGYKAYEVNPKERPISEFFEKFLKESS